MFFFFCFPLGLIDLPNRKITRLKVQTKTFVGFVLTERYHILMKQNHQKQKKNLGKT